MNVLIACEESQTVCKAFRAKGHIAYSCDIEPCSGGRPEWHLQGDVRDHLYLRWDMIVAHPPCTYLSVSGLHWNKRRPDREEKTEQALRFVQMFWDHPVPRLCIENPVGCINSRLPNLPKPQYIQPYDFGDDASKKTGLWLRGLPPLKPTKRIPGRIVTHKGKQVERWDNQTDSGQNKLPPSDTRSAERAKTYPGIAMATQWSDT